MTTSRARIYACQVKGGLLKCKSESVGTCQYCGRRFCSRHGEKLQDDQEVCSRKFCVAKKLDLERHVVYRDAVLQRNQTRYCGIDDCKRSFEGQCARCKGYFCLHHVTPRQEWVMENLVKVPRTSTLCGHCWSRRPIWLRV